MLHPFQSVLIAHHDELYLCLSEINYVLCTLYTLTSNRNASSQTLLNLLHEHHTRVKMWSILIFVCVSLNNMLKRSRFHGHEISLQNS